LSDFSEIEIEVICTRSTVVFLFVRESMDTK